MHRVFVEKQTEFNSPAKELLHDLRENLSLSNLEGVRVIQRYDIDGLSEEDFAKASQLILSEPQVETSSSELFIAADEVAFAVEYLPGQFDQRADSAAQCVTILTEKEAPLVASARVIVLKGSITNDQLAAVKDYVINAVDSREASMEQPESLAQDVTTPADVEILDWFSGATDEELTLKRNELGLAMSAQDFIFTQRYFRDDEKRNPSITEIKMLDTYWSDHCRHTTFATRLNEVAFEDGTEYVKQAYVKYQETREDVYGDKIHTRPECLMDIALMGMKELRKTGELDNVEVSEEINAASIVIPVDVDGEEQEWLLMFKNETHNHPTEIEPFGGAATCLGGCIRDPLSGRSYVYQAMRVTGAADPRTPFADTMPGKLPQRKICKGAADGYSSYGNQIGLATGQVSEVFHPNYVAKRMEIGAVVAAAPKENVFRGSPTNGDVILLIGGRTGRDGVGGATGSSKEHTDTALENSAEVQKGNAPTERKIQRLFRNPELAKKIKVCNDFGAGGVSVAIGEIAPSLEIDLDKVLKKYDGLDGTELAISESQERMAICVDPSTIDYFLAECDKENLECVKVADVTDSGRLVINWRGKTIVDFSRAFLDTNGVTLDANVEVKAPTAETPLGKPLASVAAASGLKEKFTTALSDLNSCGQKGLGEQFDSSVGAGTVLQPFGGKHQLTPVDSMVAKIPLISGNTTTCSFMSWGFNPNIATWSPYHGALYAVTESVCRIVSAGARLGDVRLTLQEYFEKLGNTPSRWGKPFAALLGAFTAQNELRLGAIGGKDSMSGSFNEIDVPPTLVSFAVAPGKSTLAVSPEFKEAGSDIYLVTTPRDENLLPVFDKLKEIAELLYATNAKGKVNAMHSLAEGGVAVGLSKMSFGNKIGATVELAEDTLFSEGYFNFLVEAKAGSELPAALNAVKIGQTAEAATLTVNDEALELDELISAWVGTLETTYPSNTEVAHSELETFTFENPAKQVKSTADWQLKTGNSRPRVVVPCFPGTNSEYDSAKMFNEAGGDAHIEVFRNLTPEHVEQSLAALAQQIKESQILMLPGGFSAGDEPDGSGKFIATVLRNPIVRDAVMDLIQNRDGLVLGICNGFQALIKTGLVPYGEIRDPQPGAPTLTFNDIGRHIACYATTRIASNKSPWLANTKVGDLHQIPFSHGEGKFYATEEEIKQLAANGQIATQYTDLAGNPSMDIRYNPNGSLYAIEGITSPCGRVLGKMGHTERRGQDVAKNVPGDKHQPLFKAGVQYFA
ncbi:phosphoribosylformylglycinamidine synthase [Rubritalea tangerina]|uniref:Phosphoribosylformylglycinamidine synthase n=1 Tax=Rubritalea tangerina TaxID=430798 RepID=A0ABW4ZFV1_9BACT